MALGYFLIHTCTTRRASEASPARDAYGAESVTWANNLTLQPCRFVIDREAIAAPGLGELIRTVYRLVVRPGADIINADRITTIATADGTSVTTDTFEVKQVLTRRSRRAHHITLELTKIE